MNSSLIRILILTVLFIYNGECSAQNTFSKVYDLGVGIDNRAQYFFLEDNSFVVATTHSGDTSVVSAFTRLDFEGNIVDQNSYADYVFGKSRSVVRTESGFEIAGHTWSLDENNARGLELVKLNKDLDFLDRVLVDYEKDRTTNLPGILDIDSVSKVVYGYLSNTGSNVGSEGYIAFLDQETDSVLSEIIFKGNGANVYGSYRIFDVQETLDTNMLFIVEVDLLGAGPGNGSHFEIIKFNKDGEVLKKIQSRDDGNNQAIVQDDEGDIYFFNKRTPFYIDSVDIWADGAGGIVKINADMDSVLWSFALEEFDMILDGRGHTINGLNQLEDGNLLGWGITGYTVVDDVVEIVANGFVCKFTKDGEVLWVREYGIPIPKEYLSLSNFGVLGTSRINDCQELDDGRILCMGENAYAKPEVSFYRELWVLMLDKNGCIEPNCDPTTVLTSTSPTIDLQQGKIYPNPVSDVLRIADVDFDAYKIHDLSGRLLQHGPYATEIQLSHTLPKGMYVLTLKDDGRLRSVFKFVKE